MNEDKPVGFTLGICDKDSMELILDYTVQAYRDASIGNFLFSKLDQYGIKKVLYRGPLTTSHVEYLKNTGFRKTADYYIKEY